MAATQWTQELKEQVVNEYTDSNPSADTSIEIVKSIAESINLSPNGVRRVLMDAGVYIKTTPKDKSTSGSEDKPKRATKADSIAKLKESIQKLGKQVDDDVLDKLTGKAAVYFNDILTK